MYVAPGKAATGALGSAVRGEPDSFVELPLMLLRSDMVLGDVRLDFVHRVRCYRQVARARSIDRQAGVMAQQVADNRFRAGRLFRRVVFAGVALPAIAVKAAQSWGAPARSLAVMLPLIAAWALLYFAIDRWRAGQWQPWVVPILEIYADAEALGLIAEETHRNAVEAAEMERRLHRRSMMRGWLTHQAAAESPAKPFRVDTPNDSEDRPGQLIASSPHLTNAPPVRLVAPRSVGELAAA